MIQPKELMLGNWVYLDGDVKYPVRIEAVYSDAVFLQPNAEGFEIFSARKDEICPIPLTEEVLLKNGFMKCDTYCTKKYIKYEYQSEDKYFDLFHYDFDDKRGYFVNMFGIDNEVKYVHQLQNILTIAGIDIDFKI